MKNIKANKEARIEENNAKLMNYNFLARSQLCTWLLIYLHNYNYIIDEIHYYNLKVNVVLWDWCNKLCTYLRSQNWELSMGIDFIFSRRITILLLTNYLGCICKLGITFIFCRMVANNKINKPHFGWLIGMVVQWFP